MTTPISVAGIYRRFPKELFRLNNGPQIRLREYKSCRGTSFDVVANKSGKIEPGALNLETYAAPNGASMRPNSGKMYSITKSFTRPQAIVYSVSQDTPLPDDLILVHERGDHYSLQAAKEMSIHELNYTITEFLQIHGTKLTKEEWLEKYPRPSGRHF